MTEEFRTLLLAELTKLHPYALSLARDRDQAADLVQQTALRAIMGERQFELGTNFNGWLCKIMKNVFLSSVRGKNRATVTLDGLPDSVFAKSATQENTTLVSEIAVLAAKLHPAQREVLELVCEAGLSYHEAAANLGTSVETVKSRLWRARVHMKQLAGESHQ